MQLFSSQFLSIPPKPRNSSLARLVKKSSQRIKLDLHTVYTYLVFIRRKICIKQEYFAMSRFTQERSKKIAHGIKDYTGCPKKIPFPRLLSCANLIYTTFYLIIYIILQKPSYSIHPVISCNILKNRFVLFLHIINMSLLCSCSFLCQPQLLCI